MANDNNTKTKTTELMTKDQLQKQMARTRESLAETVGEIKETVEQEVETIKKGAESILNFRGEFEKDPFVWSLGALSAGFALGYTVGYAHKNAKGRKKSEVTFLAAISGEKSPGNRTPLQTTESREVPGRLTIQR